MRGARLLRRGCGRRQVARLEAVAHGGARGVFEELRGVRVGGGAGEITSIWKRRHTQPQSTTLTPLPKK